MLVSDISHQVKTPVSNLKMVTETLREKPVTEQECTEFLQGIRSQTDKLDFLFQALVKTSHMEVGAVRLERRICRCLARSNTHDKNKQISACLFESAIIIIRLSNN